MRRGFLTKSRGRRRRRSGIALLVAMSTILVLTVVVTELTYTARVRFVLAAHEKNAPKPTGSVRPESTSTSSS